MSTWTTSKNYQWLKLVQFWLLPPTCVLCQRPGQTALDLCADCDARLPRLERPCPACAQPLPPGFAGTHCGHCPTDNPLSTTVAALPYAEPVSRLITAFKYHEQLAAGRVLSALLANAIKTRYPAGTLPDLLVPVPLHPTRLRQRGYNQSLLIAQDLSRALGIPVAPHLVQRRLATPPQQGLAASERRRNLRGAFSVAAQPGAGSPTRIALVDDVITTMSTIVEVARALQAAHDSITDIHAWCVARA